MGWFGLTSDNASPAPEPSKDGGYIAPDRSSRAACWEARDKFFECLDKNDILDSVKEDEKAKKVCLSDLKEFEKNCASSWVTYFKKRRVFEHQKEETIKRLEAQGATGMEDRSSPAATALKGGK